MSTTCSHVEDPYNDPTDPDYRPQPCCGLTVHVDDMDEPDQHLAECPNAPAWMKETF